MILVDHLIKRISSFSRSLELFDELVLEEQCFCFCLDNGVGDVVNLAHEHLCLEAIHLGMEIRRDAILQTLGLAHVDDGVFLVIELVAARFVW